MRYHCAVLLQARQTGMQLYYSVSIFIPHRLIVASQLAKNAINSIS